MGKQDGVQSSTKQRRSRKPNATDQEHGKQAPVAQRPANHDTEAWKAYWKAHGQEWRTEPEIDAERQESLDERRSITPNIEQGTYPFRGVKLSRADVEWLLASHESEGVYGPVKWNGDVHDQNVKELDLRGADLRRVDLSRLPLTRISGGLIYGMWETATDEQREAAAIHLEDAILDRAHLEGATFNSAHLENADFTFAKMQDVICYGTHLEKANFEVADLRYAWFSWAYLTGAKFVQANLKRANFEESHLEGAKLPYANLKKAFLVSAHLEKANFNSAKMEGARLEHAYLEGANLHRVHLEGADLSEAHLEGKEVPLGELERIRKWDKDFPALLQPADLREAFFDSGTRLNGTKLGNKENGFVTLADISWGNINLAVIDWWQVKMLGDERIARRDKTGDLNKQGSNYRKAVRANRQLAKVLLDQGLNEVSSYFARRAQILQRKVLWLDLQLPENSFGPKVLWFNGYIFSWFLDLLAGYGYKPQRSLISYVLVVITFSISYYILGQAVGPHFSPLGALVFSITSFHGRGFFPGGIKLDDPITALAALEAMIGLAIEVSLIATFTQRFFGK